MGTSTYTCCRDCLRLRYVWREKAQDPRDPRGELGVDVTGGAGERRRPAKGHCAEARSTSAGIEAAGARRSENGGARGNLFTADYFCGIAQTGVLTRDGLQELLGDFAGRDDEVDVPSGIRGRGTTQNQDEAAGIAGGRAANPDG